MPTLKLRLGFDEQFRLPDVWSGEITVAVNESDEERGAGDAGPSLLRRSDVFGPRRRVACRSPHHSRTIR
jgi:phage gp36-like protein